MDSASQRGGLLGCTDPRSRTSLRLRAGKGLRYACRNLDRGRDTPRGDGVVSGSLYLDGRRSSARRTRRPFTGAGPSGLLKGEDDPASMGPCKGDTAKVSLVMPAYWASVGAVVRAPFLYGGVPSQATVMQNLSFSYVFNQEMEKVSLPIGRRNFAFGTCL